MAPAAEILNNFTEINQVIQNKSVNGHDIKASKPRKDATPFPPLNFNQIGNMCPNIEKKPQITPSSFPYEYAMNIVIKNVLKKSKSKVNAPNFFPIKRFTLVAPIFPEP